MPKTTTTKNKNKTIPTKVSVSTFIGSLSKKEQGTAKELVMLFEKTTKEKCVMWGSIFGFGEYHYKYASGREGDWMKTGFAIRKNALTIYIMCGLKEQGSLLKDLGKHKISGGSCLYIKKIEDINLQILIRIIKQGLKDLNEKYKVK
jgi:Domain of unknown function (DU1801)